MVLTMGRKAYAPSAGIESSVQILIRFMLSVLLKVKLSFNLFRGISLQSGICSIIQQGLDLLAVLFITTVALPLSAGVVTMESSFLSVFRAVASSPFGSEVGVLCA